MLLIHGWPQSGLQWYHQIEELSKTTGRLQSRLAFRRRQIAMNEHSIQHTAPERLSLASYKRDQAVFQKIDRSVW